MGLAYERDGKLELADRQYADATKSALGNANVSLRYIAFLQRQGRIAQAEDVLTESVGADIFLISFDAAKRGDGNSPASLFLTRHQIP